MKKILLTAVALVFCMAGSASALMFSDTKTLDVILAEGPIAGLLISDSISYTHATPADFEVPWDIVNSASLTISGYWIAGNDDIVKVEGVAVGTLTPGGSKGWSWGNWSFTYTDTPSVSSFDIASTFSSWSTGADLGVTLTANGSFGDGKLHISTSTFDLDYDNQAAPVPEPSTMLLFGAGALGLFGYSRKRSHKKA
ncbi:MAG: hypothetical protein COA36_15470 [Desulfotalea sp.]|nr:MAG: hypothetical protein COA36_15470 [Desulfotalea sp.]